MDCQAARKKCHLRKSVVFPTAVLTHPHAMLYDNGFGKDNLE
jgi:hypothetical protein